MPKRVLCKYFWVDVPRPVVTLTLSVPYTVKRDRFNLGLFCLCESLNSPQHTGLRAPGDLHMPPPPYPMEKEGGIYL